MKGEAERGKSPPPCKGDSAKQMKQKLKWLAKVFMLCTIPLYAQASVPAHKDTSLLKKAESFVQLMTHGYGHALSTFSGPDGLVGVVVKMGPIPSEPKKILWLTKDGDYAVAGTLINPYGADETAHIARKMGFLPKPVGKAVFFKNTVNAAGFADGIKGPTIHVYFDPNCSFCNRFYNLVEPDVKAGKLRVHWIPVSLLPHDSIGRAVAIMSADIPSAAMALNESHFDQTHELGGIKPIDSGRLNVFNKIFSNTRLLLAGSGGIAGTPTIVFKGKHGIQVLHGMTEPLKTIELDLTK
ncbi:MAG: thioredoxin fold domain-containing protein [Pseudomonadota bacterium]|nr:thioredoxin fold domain-containing protein [Pseudomonadota bacterium]